MPRQPKPFQDAALLSAALEGLEIQRRRIEEQIEQVRSLLGGRRPKAGAASPKTGGKRELSPEARKRIAMAQKRRWAEYRKNKAQASQS